MKNISSVLILVLALVAFDCFGQTNQLTVSITNPVNNASFAAPTNLTINATASASTGTVTQVQFLVGTKLLGVKTNSPYSVTWSNAPVGTHALTAIATDNTGLTGTSSVVNISISTNLLPIADAHVRDGSSTNTNFRTNIVMECLTTNGSGNNRDIYFKFDLIGVSNISSAQLKVFAKLGSTNSISNTVYSVTNTSWLETNITWNNKPARVMALTTNSVTGTNWYLFDVTGFIQSQKNAGSNIVCLALHDPTNYSLLISINSKENTTNKPSLVVVTTNSPLSVSITNPVNNALFAAPANITINASAADSDGTVTQVQFFQGTNSLGGATSAPYSVTWSNVSSGTYALTARAADSSGLTSTSSVINVVVDIPPSITAQPTNQTVTKGSNAVFTVTAAGTAPLSYRWLFNGTNTLAGFTNASITITNAQSTNTGNYSVVVTNVVGSVTSSNAVLALLTPPTITAQPTNQAAVQGTNVTFSVTATGTAPLNYQWRFNVTNLLLGATNSTLVMTNVQSTNAGNYSVVVTNVVGSATSSNASLTVRVPPSITTQPTNQTVKQGSNAVFTVTAAGTAPLSYRWRFNGTNITRATNLSLTITNVQSTNAGNYSVVVTNVVGSVTSSNAVLTVLVPPLITQQPTNQAVNPGGTATFSVTVSSNSTPPLSYQWYFNSVVQTNATNAVLTLTGVTTNQAGPYWVVVTNVTGSLRSSNAVLTVTGPWLTLPSGPMYYTNGAAPKLIDPAATVVAPTNFNLGRLTVSVIANTQLEDVLTINNQGTSTNQIGITNNFVTYWGTKIATFSGGRGANALVVNFTNSPTVTTGMVQALVRNIAYHYYPSSTNDSDAPRTVQFVLSNQSGNTNFPATKVIYLGCPSALNVMFVIDCSGSMAQTLGNTNTTKLSAATNAAISFITSMQFPVDQGGLVTFTDAVVNVSGLTNNGNLLISKIAGLMAGGNTDTGDGILTAQNDFPTNSANNSLPLMILMTDGVPNRPTSTNVNGVNMNATNYMIYRAAQARLAGIRLITIGLGTNGNLANFNPVLLTNLASSADDCYVLTNTAGLRSVYTNIAYSLCRQITTNQLPTVSFISPTNNQIFVTSPLNIPLTAATTDYSGTVTNVQFFNGTNLLGNVTVATNNTWTLLWTNVVVGNYSLKVKAMDNLGNNATNSVIFTVNAMPPVIAQQPANQAVNPGGTAAFSVTVSTNSTPPLSYQWYFNSSVQPNATNAVLTLTGVTTNQAGTYWVVVTNVAGSVTSSNAVLTLNVPPLITQQPANQTVNPGGTAAFSVTVSTNSTPPLSYQWYFNSGVLANATNAALPLTNVQPNQAGTYWVVMTNVAGSVASSNAVLTLNVPPSITQQPVNVTTNVGGTAAFSVTATGTQPLSYQWYFNSGVLADATNAALTLTGVTTNQAGTYSVTVTNVAGSAASSNAVLTVLVPPLITQQPVSVTTNACAKVTFGVAATGTLPLSYQWYFNSNVLANATGATLTLTNVMPGQAGNYSVTVTNMAGSATSSNAMLTVIIPPCTPAPSNLVNWWQAEGNAADSVGGNNGTLVNGASFTNGMVGQAFNFSGANQYVSTASTGSLSGTFTIEFWAMPMTLSGTLGILGSRTPQDCSYDLKFSSGSIYSDIGNGSSWIITGASVPCAYAVGNWYHIATVVTPTNYTTYVNGAVAGSGSYALNNPLLFNANHQIKIGYAGYGTEYMNGRIDEMTIYSRALSQSEIQAVYNAGISGKCPLPLGILAQPANVTTNVGANVTFNVVATGMPPFSYQWYFNSSALADKTNAVLALTGVTTNQAGTYSVTVTNLSGSVASSNATLTVNVPPVITQQPANQAVNPGGTAAFSVTVSANSTPPLSYQWYFNSGVLANATNAALPLMGVTTNQAGTYSVTVMNAAGSATSSNAVLTVNVPPSITQQPVNVTTNVGGTAAFSVTATGTQPLSYQWYFNSGVLADATNAALTLTGVTTNQAGTYSVTVTNVAGSAASSNATLTVNVPPVVDAGPDRVVVNISDAITLNGVVTDDGVPPNTPLTIQWRVLAGPGNVTFGNSNSAVTTATFSTNGIYVLQLTANDSLCSSSNIMEVRAGILCSVTAPSGLVAWWPGNFSVADVAGGHNAVLHGSAGFAMGEVGPAFQFNGVTDYVQVPANTNLDVGQSPSGFTLEFWVNLGSGGDASVLSWNNGSVNGVNLMKYSDWLCVNLMDTNGMANSVGCVSGVFNTQWHHVAVTYDRVAGIGRIYVDGVIRASSTVGSFVPQTSYDLYFGRVLGASLIVSGRLDEISLYQRPLNPQEVYSIYASGSVGKCPNDGNQAPVVYAGPDQFVEGVPGMLQLQGQATDDGLPTGSTLRTQWSVYRGPGTVTFANSNAPVTQATFGTNGIYVLQLTADDGEAQSSDLVEVRVETVCTVQDPQGLAAWWPANGTSEDVLSGEEAILVNGANYAAGEVASAFNFNGNNYVWVPKATNYDVGQSPSGFTLEFWVNLGSSGNGSVLSWNNGSVNGVCLTKSTDWLCVNLMDTNGMTNSVGCVSGVFNSQWHHVAVTYDRVAGIGRIYVDGVIRASSTVGSFVPQTSYDLYFGQVAGYAPIVSGRLDEISLYKRPLNPEEVNNIFVSGSVGKCPNDGNQAPVVYAGPDFSLSSTNDIGILNGGVADDGLPAGSDLRMQWSVYCGPGSVTFAISNSAATPATFSTNGIYVLQLTADDGEAKSSDLVEVRVGTPCVVQDIPGLTAWWPANGTPKDKITGQSAILVNGVTYGVGEVASAFNFNGNNYMWVPKATNYDVGQSPSGFTLEFWVNLGSGGDASVLSWNNGSVNGVNLMKYSDWLCVNLMDTNGMANSVGCVSGVFNSQWHHVAVTYDRVAGIGRIYVDGVIRASSTVGSFVPQTSYDLYFGRVLGASLIVSGRLDEISLYQRPLNPQEIYSIYASGSVGKCPNDNNQPPVVYAGPDFSLPSTNDIGPINGEVTDDGLPVGSSLQVQWSVYYGPGTVTFANSNLAATTATFSTNGIYVLQLTANDGEAQSSGLVEMRVGTPCVVQDIPGLTAWWPANGTSADVISGQNAILGSGTGYTNGAVVMAFNFDGANDYVWVPKATNYDVGQSPSGFTLEFWVNLGSGGDASVLSWNNGSVNGVCLTKSSDWLCVNLMDTNGMTNSVGCVSGVFNSQWHHVAVTYDRVAGIGRIYVDGVIRASSTVGSFVPQTSYDLYFGQVAGYAPIVSGRLDEISLYQRPLNPEEINSIYASGSVGKCPSDLIQLVYHQPTVEVAAPPIITLPTNQLVLNGTVIDSGLPVGGRLYITWSQTSGPGTVSFAPQTATNALMGMAITNQLSTVATFSAPGQYVVRLTVDDTLNTNQVEVAITVNQAPVVDAGSDQVVSFAGLAVLRGTVQDDGLPVGAVVTSQWVQISGPGFVRFANAQSLIAFATFSKPGTYRLALVANDTVSYGMSELTVTVVPPQFNQPPTVYAGINQVVGGTNVAALQGVVTDDNFFGTGFLNICWAQQSGPGTVTFANSNAPATSAAFSQSGTYVLVLSANDSQYTNSDRVTIAVFTDNMPPTVNPGLNQTNATSMANLAGQVTDDGLPTGVPLTVSWTKVSGPGSVFFGSPASAVTPVSFDQPGVYVLRLTADDSQYSVSSNVTITVRFNQAPQVSAGPDQQILNTHSVVLQGWAGDDGLPSGSTLATAWSLVGGSGVATFVDAHQTNTAVLFSDQGTYQLRLTATDGELTNSDDVNILVTASNAIPYQATNFLYRFVSHLAITNFYNLDFDESSFTNGQAGFGTYGACIACSFNKTNYIKTYWPGNSGGAPDLLLRKHFYVPPGTTNLSMGFTVDNNAQIFINGVLITNADKIFQFGQSVPNALQSGWYNHEGCPNYDDLLLVGVSTNLWHEGYNLLAVRAYDSGCEAFCDVRIGLDVPANVWENQPPVPITSDTQFVVLPAMADLTASVQDDGYPLDGEKTAEWVKNIGPGTVTFSRPTASFATNNDVSTMAAFSEPGTYTLQLAANDSVFGASAYVTVFVSAVSNQPPVVSAGADQTIALGNAAALGGTATDDGLPSGTLDTSWDAVSGTGNVYFFVIDDVTYADFDAIGDYVLRFSAYDGNLTSTSDVTVHVVSSTGRALRVSLQFPPATDRSIGADLGGTVFDDGQPAGSVLSVVWSSVGGPGAVAFSQVSSNFPNVSAHADFSIAGIYILRMTASDGELNTSVDAAITVTDQHNGNHAPVVNAGPTMTATTMSPVTLNGTASDDGLPAGGTLTTVWTQLSGPGTVFVGNPAATNTTATFNAPGIYELQLTASDGQLSSSDYVTVMVTNSAGGSLLVYAGSDLAVSRPNAVWLEGMVLDGGLPPGDSPAYQWSKVSGPGTVTFTQPSTLNPQLSTNVTDWLPVDDTEALASATFSVDGSYVLRLSATDTQITNTDDITVTVYDAANLPPVAELYAPEDGAIITAPTDIIGTASSPILQSYQLQYRLKNPDDATPAPWTVFATGSSSVVNGPLGSLDPTLLLNGIYELQLVAADLMGRTASTAIQTFSVERNLKIGNFTLSFRDLNVPVSGIPIEIVRTYDSRDQRTNDFGVGWSLDIRNIRLQKTRSLGPNWYQYSYDDVWAGVLLTTYALDPMQPREITITMAGDKVYHFQAVLSPTKQPAYPIESVHMTFTNLPGTHGGLAIDGDNEATVDSPLGYVQLINMEDFSYYNPTRFRFTNEVGDVYIIDEKEGLKSLTDRNQNTLIIATNGIIWTNAVTHNSGVGVSFVRDGQGRITQIIDPSSNALNYAYGTNGSLAAFTDRATNTTAFAYTNAYFPHYLTGITDPRGNQAIRAEYDDNGRMVRQIDADNNVINFNHDFGNDREEVTDRLGHTTVHYYDDRGNVVATIDALGGLTTYKYDDVDNVLEKVDALGNTNSYTYDGQGNKLTETDPLGNTTRYTYGPYHQLTTVTTPRDYTNTNVYDPASGVLTQQSDPLGHVTTYSYDFGGNLLALADALGNVISNNCDGNGHITSTTVIDAQRGVLNSSSFTYDANGNRLTQIITRTTPHGVETLTTRFAYDSENRLIQTIHPDGSTNQTIYAVGLDKPAVEIDALGLQTLHFYDERGDETNVIHPDLTSESFFFDAENRKIAETDAANHTTHYTNDALGRVTITVYPDGTGQTNYYDPVGRTWAVVDVLGNPTFYGYDAAGRNTSVTNALNQVTRYEYDQSGNRVAMIDSFGRTNRFIYDALNRRVQTVFADGTSQTTWYNELGRRTYEQDQAGKTTAFGYDTLGRLTAVTNAMGYVTSYAYDELGQQISQTDANLHTTTFEYDSLGRRVKRTLPDNQVETYAYNIGGQLTNKTDFNGYTTTYQYDQMNRLVAKLPDASRSESSVTFAYNTLGLRTNMTDASGATAYVYDDRNRLAQKTKTFGGASYTSTLNYSYDPNGNLTNIVSSDPNGANVGYEYDALSRLSAVDDTKSGQTVYNYDEVGNLKNYIYPNLVRSEYQYNSLNRLTNLASDKLLTPIANYAYTVGPAGNRLTASETIIRDPLNPVPHTINRVYSYDNIYRLTGETINGAPSAGSASYNYDPVGNRLARNSTLPELLSQSFTFDGNDRLNTDTYDNNGNTLLGAGFGQTQADQYDFENRLTTRHTPSATITIKYDGDGNRVSKTVTTATNAVTTFYVVDDLNPSGYAQVLEELSILDPPSSIIAVTTVYTYGHTLISQDRFDGVTWRTSFYGYDGHNNVRYLTDVGGNVSDTYDYDAFGNLIAQSSIYQTPTTNSYLYCGEQFDSDLGLYFLRARYMNSDTGRFWNMDEFDGFNTDPISLHRYLYANAQPITCIDPSGQMTLSELMTVGSMWKVLSAGLAGYALGQFVVDPTLGNAIQVGLSVLPFLGPAAKEALWILRFTKFKIGYFSAAKYWEDIVKVGGSSQQMGRYFEVYVRMLLWVQKNPTKYFFRSPAANCVPDYVFKTFRWFGRIEALGDAKYWNRSVGLTPQTRGFILATVKEGADKFIFYVKKGGEVTEELIDFARRRNVQIIKVEISP